MKLSRGVPIVTIILFCLLWQVGSFSCPLAWAEKAEVTSPLPSFEHLSSHHPRLLINSEILKGIHNSIESNALAASEYQSLKKRAAEILTQPPVQFQNGDLLEVSRTALKRIYTLGLVYQLQPEPKLVERAKNEMFAICSFPSWHPDHFLDVAEMTNALAIGYDWFYDALNENERAKIRAAIVTLGLQEGMKAHEQKRYFWVTESNSNWCIVCYGGLLLGALAVAKDERGNLENKLIEKVLPIAVDSLRRSFRSFGPDGAWVEGVGYWNYATIYATSSIAALETSLGSDFGLSAVNGLNRAGLFYVNATSPNYRCFDFADAEPYVRNSPQLFWFAKRYHLPVLAYEERYLLEKANDKLDVRDLIWFDPAGSIEDLKALPLIAKFRGATQLVTMRSSWTDPEASFLAFKGGDNSTHHAHLELGTFVFDANGYRWVTQMGVENYDLPGYFDREKGDAAPRWTYYRTKTEGQNTVVIEGANQDFVGKGSIVESIVESVHESIHESVDEAKLRTANLQTANNFDLVALNLDQAYASRGINHFSRTFLVSKQEPHSLLVRDDIAGSHAFDAMWQMHTRADVRIEGDKAILSHGSQKLLVKVLSPAKSSLSVVDVNLPLPQLDSKGIKKLVVTTQSQTGKVCFTVLLLPFAGSEPTTLPAFDFAELSR